MTTNSYPLLSRVNDPADLRRLSRAELGQLATELRAFLLDSVSKTGGHLSSNLGTVELTVALHHASACAMMSGSVMPLHPHAFRLYGYLYTLCTFLYAL